MIAVSDSITEEEEMIAVSDSITEEEEPVITTTTIEEETTLVSDATIEEEMTVTTVTIEEEEELTLSTSTTCEHEDESDIDAVEKVISTVSDVVTVEEDKMTTVESTSLMPTPTFPDDDDMFSVIQTAIHTRLPESDEEVDDEHYHIKNDGFSLSSDLLMRNYTTDPYIPLSDSEYDEPVELDHATDSLSKSYNNDTDHDDVDYSGRYMSIRTIVSPPSPSLSFNDEDDTAEHGNHHNDGYLNGMTRQLQVNALNTTDGSLVVEKFEDDATFSDVASDMDELNTGRISPASSSFMEKLSLLANAHPMTTTTTDLVEHTEDEVDSDEEVDTELMEAKLRAMLNRSTALSDDEQLVIAPQDIPLPPSPFVSITVTDTSIAPHDIPLPPSPFVSITDNEEDEESVADAFDANDYQTSTIPPVGKVELPL
ncbi:hypothetical protein BDF22DRAFT_686335 [Syncephalis plumigaleata]|nr:hypothetical protein BDF22DRAFT_686335 [Syncephalis plumigaleata]